MILLTYDTPRPRPGTFPGVPDTVNDLPDLPEPLEDGPEVAIDEDEVPPARGPETEPP